MTSGTFEESDDSRSTADRGGRSTASGTDSVAGKGRPTDHSGPPSDVREPQPTDVTDSAGAGPGCADGASPAVVDGTDEGPAGTVSTTGRWRGVHALSVGAVAVAVLVGSPPALLAGLVGVAFGAYATVFDPPEAKLHVERTVNERDPDPGERVRVTLTIRNDANHLLPDLRFCDGVPAGLVVVEGTARHTTALRPGKETTIEYTVRAVRGNHEFEGLHVVSRNVSGAQQWVARVPTPTTGVHCRPRFDQGPYSLETPARRLVGRHESDTAGHGVAFHSVREYRRGDAPSRIDWNQFAKTGELSTRRYEQPRRLSVVLIVDARREAYVSTDDGRHPPRPAVDDCVFAAGRFAATLLDADVRVGLGALGSYQCWLAPSAGRTHRDRLFETLTGHDAFDWARPSSGQDGFDRILDRLPPDAQVVICSPCTDDAICAFAHELDVRGRDVTVVSPSVTSTETTAGTVAAIERSHRLRSLRAAGISVCDVGRFPRRSDDTAADRDRPTEVTN